MTMPSVPSSGLVPDLLAHGVRRRPDGDCVVVGDRRMTFAEVSDRASRFAAVLRERGLAEGARVAVLALNEPELLEIRAGSQRAGTVLVPLNHRLSAAELQAIVADCEPELLVGGPELDELVAALGLPALRLGAEDERTDAYETALAAADPVPLPPALPAGRLGLISYTSGTTGRPKGVMLSNGALHATIAACGHEIGAHAGGRYLAAMPMFHVGIAVGLAFTMLGAPHHQLRRFDADALLTVLATESITHTQLVPTMIHALLDRAGEQAPRALERILYGAAPMPPELVRRVLSAWSCELVNGYGSTEVMMISSLAPEEHDAERAPELLGSVGRSGWGTTARVAGPDGSELAAGEIGEVVATGPTIMSGYWRNEPATREVLRQGWVHTGDLGYRDERGYLFLVDRRDDKIVTGGENVYPSEVEHVLLAHDDIDEAAVVGVPHPVWGEAISAVVVVRPGASLEPDAVIAHCRARLAGYKTPKQVRFAERLPRTATGKLLRREIRRTWPEPG